MFQNSDTSCCDGITGYGSCYTNQQRTRRARVLVARVKETVVVKDGALIISDEQSLMWELLKERTVSFQQLPRSGPFPSLDAWHVHTL